MAERRVAWWVRPVNRLMSPAVRRAQHRADQSFSALRAQAARRAGAAAPAGPHFLDELRVIHDAYLAVPELSFIGLAGIRAELARHLSNRMRVSELLQANPRIAAEPVSRPVFVVGLPRTGTTVLHALLASAPGHRAPLLWELLDPCPRPGDPASRIRDAERLARLAYQAAPGMRVIHQVDAREPEECVFALPHHMAYYTRARLPGYRDWYVSRDATDDYVYLRQQLQVLQWQQPRKRWILKSPFHLWQLDALLRVFPDATIVWPHRDLPTVFASWCSLTEVTMLLYNQRVDLHQIGRDWIGLWSEAVTRALRVRAGTGVGAAEGQSFVDLSHADLAGAPLPTLEALFSRLGAELTREVRDQVASRARTSQAQTRGHQYRLDRYGLTASAVRDAFPDPMIG